TSANLESVRLPAPPRSLSRAPPPRSPSGGARARTRQKLVSTRPIASRLYAVRHEVRRRTSRKYASSLSYAVPLLRSDLAEAPLADNPPSVLTIVPERRNHRHEHDRTGVVEKPRDLCRPSDVLRTVRFREGKVAVQAKTEVVTVEHHNVAPLLVEP